MTSVAVAVGDLPRQGTRFQEMDVFRGMAALWVLYYHYIFQYRIAYHLPAAPWGWFSVSGMPERDVGELAVYFFFIISGFAMCITLETKGAADFCVSRFSRIFPAYWAAMALTALMGIVWPLRDQNYTLPQLLSHVAMLQEVLGYHDIDGVYWSLLIELVFYCFVGTALALGLLGELHRLCLVWAVACIADHALARLHHDIWWIVQKYGLLLHGHFFIAGIMYYHLWKGRRTALSRAILGLCAVSVVLAYPPVKAAICLAFFVLFEMGIKGRLRFLSQPPLLWLGSISYSLYLCHNMLGYRVIAWTLSAGYPMELGVALATGISLAMAMALTRFVEQPAMRGIRHMWERRKDSVSSNGI